MAVVYALDHPGHESLALSACSLGQIQEVPDLRNQVEVELQWNVSIFKGQNILGRVSSAV